MRNEPVTAMTRKEADRRKRAHRSSLSVGFRTSVLFRVSAVVLAGLVGQDLGAQQKVDIRRAATANVAIRLSGNFSAIAVSQWAHDSLALTGTVGPGTRLDGGPLNATGPVQGMKFYVEAPEGASIAGNRLELRVPRSARVWLKAGSADITVDGVAGGLDLNIIGGSIRVTGKPRELLVESMDGEVTFSGFAEFARIKTATGDITVTEGGGEDINLSTVSGTIRMSPGERPLQRGRFESVTGPINFTGKLDRGADLRFDTHSGAVDLRIPRPSNLEMDAMSITGSIENAWSQSRPIAGREGRGSELGFSSGMGGARISIRSFKGNVRIAPAP
jgi:hypothetical protein